MLIITFNNSIIYNVNIHIDFQYYVLENFLFHVTYHIYYLLERISLECAMIFCTDARRLMSCNGTFTIARIKVKKFW